MEMLSLSEQRAAPHLNSAVSERSAGRDTIMTVLITHLRFKGIAGLFALWVFTVSRIVQPFEDSLRAWKTFVLLIRRLKESTRGRRALCLSAADCSITHDENRSQNNTATVWYDQKQRDEVNGWRKRGNRSCSSCLCGCCLRSVIY